MCTKAVEGFNAYVQAEKEAKTFSPCCKTWVVSKGETLWTIAEHIRDNSDVDAGKVPIDDLYKVIMDYNNMDSASIQIGDEINLPDVIELP